MHHALETAMVQTCVRRFRSLLLAGLLAAPATSSTQSRLGSERADVGDFAGDIWSIWVSPAGIQRRDLLTVGATLGAAALTSRIDSAGYIWLQTHDRTLVMQLLSPLRDSARFSPYEFGSGQYLLPFSALLYIAGRLSHSANLRDAGLGCAAGHISSLGLRQVVFRSIKRGRPSVTADPFEISVPGTSEWARESFYSGHISNSMACASFMTHRFSLGVAEPLPYLFSTAIGIGRLADGHHWASDMVVGGVVGFAVGKAIAARQLRRHATVSPALGAPAAPAASARWQIPVAQWSVVF
jgi:membrane-associated phospholipid phosphatase